MHKIVTDLSGDHDFIPLIRKRFGDQFFAQSVAVSVSGIEKRDPEIERLWHQSDRFAFGEISPPTSRNRPQTKTNLAHRQVSILVSPKAHKVGKIKAQTKRRQ